MMESKGCERDTEQLEVTPGSDYRQSLLVNPKVKPNIGPVETNAALIDRLNAFLPEFKRSTESLDGTLSGNEPGIELPDDHEGEHVELDLACGMFDLKDGAAVEAAEKAMRVGGDPGSPLATGSEEDGVVHPGITEIP